MLRLGIIVSMSLLAVLLLSVLPNAFAWECYEILPDGGSNDLCGLTSGNATKIFQSFNQPLETQLAGFSLVILWGGLIGILWFKTERIDIIGIAGLVIAGTAVGLSSSAIGIGFFLLLVSLGVLLFQVIRHRPTIFS